MAKESLEQKVKNLEETVKSCMHEIERLQAVNEIQNMMSKYEYLHANNRHKEVMAMYAKKQPDTRVNWGEIGYWEGYDAPQRCWGILDEMTGNPELLKGQFHFHPTMCPMIVVAADGKTAKGVWTTFGFESGRDRETGKLDPQYAWGTYGVDLIKEDGQWKFWHFHIYRLVMHPVNKPWTTKEGWDPDKKGMELPEKSRSDHPGVDDYPYRTDAVVILKPDPIEPYETWADTTPS